MTDEFYVLPKNRQAKELLVWSKLHCLKLNIDELDCRISFLRQSTNKTFDEILDHLTPKSFLRVILRKNWNPYMILLDSSERIDIVEVGAIIDYEQKEYFFFIYLKADYLNEIKSKFKLQKI